MLKSKPFFQAAKGGGGGGVEAFQWRAISHFAKVSPRSKRCLLYLLPPIPSITCSNVSFGVLGISHLRTSARQASTLRQNRAITSHCIKPGALSSTTSQALRVGDQASPP